MYEGTWSSSWGHIQAHWAMKSNLRKSKPTSLMSLIRWSHSPGCQAEICISLFCIMCIYLLWKLWEYGTCSHACMTGGRPLSSVLQTCEGVHISSYFFCENFDVGVSVKERNFHIWVALKWKVLVLGFVRCIAVLLQKIIRSRGQVFIYNAWHIWSFSQRKKFDIWVALKWQVLVLVLWVAKVGFHFQCSAKALLTLAAY